MACRNGGRHKVGIYFFFSSRRRHTRFSRDWSSDVCSSDVLGLVVGGLAAQAGDRGLALGFLGGGDFLAGLHLGLHRHDRVGGLAEQGGGGLLVVREGGEAGDDGAELLVGHRVVVGPLAQR